MREETFGPTITIAKVRDEDEAVARANASRYGLGAAVFSAKHGREIAEQALRRLRQHQLARSPTRWCRSCPFGGRARLAASAASTAPTACASSPGRAVSPSLRFRAPLKVTTFNRPKNARRLLTALVRARWGRTARRRW